MNLHLVDLDFDLVECWRKRFSKFPEVQIHCGNILDIARCCVVSPANSYGYMDGGIDWEYVKFFGQHLQVNVQKAILRRPEEKLPVGASLLVRTGHQRIPFLIVAPTMEMPMAIGKANCYHAMVAVMRIATLGPESLSDVYCPGLGTGVGQVPPKDAAGEMAKAYKDWIERQGPV